MQKFLTFPIKDLKSENYEKLHSIAHLEYEAGVNWFVLHVRNLKIS